MQKALNVIKCLINIVAHEQNNPVRNIYYTYISRKGREIWG